MQYLGIDGDDIGAKLELSLLENSEENVRSLSNEVDAAILNMAQKIKALGMEVIFFSGDSLLCKGKQLDIEKLIEILKAQSVKFHFSAGIGNTLRDTYLALKYAKTSGKNRIVIFASSEYQVINLTY